MVESGANSASDLPITPNPRRREVVIVLCGEFKHNVDAKNRFFIPAKMRDELGASFVVVKSLRENCLKMYSMEGWEAYLAPIREQNRKLAERALRFLNGSMAQAEPDSQGRIVLPQELLSYAGIEKCAVVVGCGDYAEIWSESAYNKMKQDEDLAAMVAELESFGL
ncbi:MAG: division/cell wall cluster transcriptional repressor MraZ [Clostridia bacterium]|nr:division/cell wall cluster transcriptional repressor MraZ [Clostridia bacterium]